MHTDLHEATQVITDTAILHITIGEVTLEGELALPSEARGLVIFAQGNGSGRPNSRTQYIARRLQSRGMATLLADLLTQRENNDYRSRFDIALLTERLAVITDWAVHAEQTRHLPIGYYGASAGAVAAIQASMGSETIARAIVSRGGLVDLADNSIETLHVPTLLIVGQEDYGVRRANEEMFLKLSCVKEIAVIPHHTHSFEEPGTLERVAHLASVWFADYLGDQQ
jgi:putative phosphoribosyl transferase